MEWMTKRDNDEHDIPRVGSISVNLEANVGEHYVPGMEMQIDPAVIYHVAVPRILEFFEALQVRATFFVVGKDLVDDHAVGVLKEVTARGHEVASLSYSYEPNLRRWSKLSVAEEIQKSGDIIRHAIGQMPTGFRTPGYNVDTRIVQLLAERGYKYDSSVLPSLPYYLLKGGVSAARSMFRGRNDKSRLAVQSLKAPLQPYRPSRWAFWEAGDRKHSLPIWEMPIGVVRGLGAPLTGVLVTTTQPSLLRPLARALKGKQVSAQLTLHAMDFLDSDDEEISGAFRRVRANMRLSRQTKTERMRIYIDEMTQHTRIITLDELADHLSALAGPTVLG